MCTCRESGNTHPLRGTCQGDLLCRAIHLSDLGYPLAFRLLSPLSPLSPFPLRPFSHTRKPPKRHKPRGLSRTFGCSVAVSVQHAWPSQSLMTCAVFCKDVQAIQDYLSTHKPCTSVADFESTATKHATSVVTKLRRQPLQFEDGRKLVQIIVEGPWPTVARDFLLEAINETLLESTEDAATSSCKWKIQRLITFAHYADAQIVAACANKLTMKSKLMVAARLLGNLSCFNPNEKKAYEAFLS